MITADTITDEQIRELRREQLLAWRTWTSRSVHEDKTPCPIDPKDLDHSFIALREDKDGGRPGLFSAHYITRADARARCAEILEARRAQVTADTLNDEQIESELAAAISREDFEMVDLCETALKTIVEPNLLKQARERIAARLNARRSS